MLLKDHRNSKGKQLPNIVLEKLQVSPAEKCFKLFDITGNSKTLPNVICIPESPICDLTDIITGLKVL